MAFRKFPVYLVRRPADLNEAPKPVGFASMNSEASGVLAHYFLHMDVSPWGMRKPEFYWFKSPTGEEVGGYFDQSPLGWWEEKYEETYPKDIDEGIDRLVDAQEAMASGEIIAWGRPGSVFYDAARVVAVCAKTRTAVIEFVEPGPGIEGPPAGTRAIVQLDGRENTHRIGRWSRKES